MPAILSTPNSSTHFINGKFIEDDTQGRIEVINPLDGSVLGFVPDGDADSIAGAVKSAAIAFPKWRDTPVKERVQTLFRLKSLLESEIDDVANMISRENGKTHGEAKAEIEKGIEVIEFATSLPQILQQESLEVGRGVECKQVRAPLGIVAGITPFNFPAMVPLWMIPIAIATGNAFILKPSEQVPLTANLLADILNRAGLPAGIFNVVHGRKGAVEAIVDHPQVKAIGFVGSSAVAKVVYERGVLAGKRVLALGGAKNHLVVMPDADPGTTAANVVASAFGCAGQRCMAASVVILVGQGELLLPKIVEEAKKFKAGINLGPVISQGAKARIEAYISRAEHDGAKILLDGRNTIVSARQSGTYVNPTILDGVEASHEAACDEIFGPVLTVLRAGTLDEALEIENASPYGNAAAIYTTSGAAAKYFSDKASAGMIGVNVGVPVPREPFSFGGWNNSRFGYGDITGMEGIRFWTNLKKITTKWGPNNSNNWMS